jgi:tetratricopeptide (TPR) repeat protein
MATAHPPSDVDDDPCGFLKQHVCSPLAEAFAIDAARVHAVHVTPSWPEALRAPAVVADCVHRLREQLSDSKSWSVREAGLRATPVVVARFSGVMDVVKAAAAAAGVTFKDAFPLRDALAAAVTAGITEYLRSDEHPLCRGLPVVVLRRRLFCPAANGVLELQFPGPLDQLKAALVPSTLMFNLESFMVSRVAAFAVDRRDGDIGFLPHAIGGRAGAGAAAGGGGGAATVTTGGGATGGGATGGGATGTAGAAATRLVLVTAGVAVSAFPAPLPWTAPDVVFASVGDFTEHTDAATARVYVPVAVWRIPSRLVDHVCTWAHGRGAATLDGLAVARAIRDDAVAATNEFLSSPRGAECVSLASRLRVVPSAAADAVVLVFDDTVAALCGELERVTRPVRMTAEEVASLWDSGVLYSVLHRAVFKLQLPLATYLLEQLPAFFEACLTDRECDGTATDADDPRHIANVIYRLAGMPGDPLDEDWGDVRPMLSDGRRIVAAGVGTLADCVFVVSGADATQPLVSMAALSSAVAVPVNDSSLTPADSETARRAVKMLTEQRGVFRPAPPSLGTAGGTWLRPPRLRDNGSSGLRFHHLEQNKGESFRSGEFDYNVRRWLDAVKLFLADSTHASASVDVYAWDMSNLMGAMERNAWLLRPLAAQASMSVADMGRLMTAMRKVRNEGAHPIRITREQFKKCMDIVKRLAELCGEASSSSLVEELTDMRASPESYGAPRDADAPFPSFVQPEDEVFVGHDALVGRLITSLRSSLGRDGGGAPTIVSQAISGLGGVGKSTIARLLCRRVRYLRYFVHGIFWVSGESVSALLQDYQRMSAQLQLDFDASKPNAARDAVFAWMRKFDRWLLVLDNVDEPEAVTNYVPPTDVRGHVLITTRSGRGRLRDCGLLRGEGDEPVVLECLDATTSLSLLCQLCKRDAESLTNAERRAAERLCSYSDGLPLAIEQDAAYMRSHHMGFVEYVHLYKSQRKALSGVEATMSAADAMSAWQKWLQHSIINCSVDDETIDALTQYGVKTFDGLRSLSKSRERLDRALSSLSRMQRDDLWDALTSGDGVPVVDDKSRRSVRTTFGLSMKSLDPAHVEMIRLLCNLGADGIPVDAIVACVRSLPDESVLRQLVFGVGSCDGNVKAVVERLAEYSLVKCQWTKSASLVSLHRLLQAVVWETSPPDARKAVTTACMDGLASGLEQWMLLVGSRGLASDEAGVMRSWLPHADRVRESCDGEMADDSTDAAGAVGVGTGTGTAGSGAGSSVGASFGGLASNVGSSLVVERRRVDLLGRLVGVVAHCYQLLVQFDRAVTLFRRALELRHMLHADRPSRDVALALRGLAGALHARHRGGDVEESAELHQKSLEAFQLVHGESTDHADIAVSLRHYARVLREQDATYLPAAVRMHRQALEMFRRLCGAGPHPEIVVSLQCLAEVLRAMGELTASARLYRDALTMTRALHGGDDADHEDIVTVLAELAGVVGDLGDDEERDVLLEEARAMSERLGGGLTSAVRLADEALRRGDVGESTRLYSQALAALHDLHAGCECLDVAGSSVLVHPEVASLYRKLGNASRCAGELTASVDSYSKSLAVVQRLRGEEVADEDAWSILRELAVVLRARGRLTEAAERCRQALDMVRRLRGEGNDDGDVAMAYAQLALVLRDLDQLDESEACYHHALGMSQRLHDGADHGAEVALLARLAAVVRARGDSGRAYQLEEESFAMYSRLHGCNSDALEEAPSAPPEYAKDILHACAEGYLDDLKSLMREHADFGMWLRGGGVRDEVCRLMVCGDAESRGDGRAVVLL